MALSHQGNQLFWWEANPCFLLQKPKGPEGALPESWKGALRWEGPPAGLGTNSRGLDTTWAGPGLRLAQGLWGSDHFLQVILQLLGLPLKMPLLSVTPSFIHCHPTETH